MNSKRQEAGRMSVVKNLARLLVSDVNQQRVQEFEEDKQMVSSECSMNSDPNSIFSKAKIGGRLKKLHNFCKLINLYVVEHVQRDLTKCMKNNLPRNKYCNDCQGYFCEVCCRELHFNHRTEDPDLNSSLILNYVTHDAIQEQRSINHDYLQKQQIIPQLR